MWGIGCCPEWVVITKAPGVRPCAHDAANSTWVVRGCVGGIRDRGGREGSDTEVANFVSRRNLQGIGSSGWHRALNKRLAFFSCLMGRRTRQLSRGAEESLGNTRGFPCSTGTSITSSLSFSASMLYFDMPARIMLIGSRWGHGGGLVLLPVDVHL